MRKCSDVMEIFYILIQKWDFEVYTFVKGECLICITWCHLYFDNKYKTKVVSGV